jgi:hypothetical protein
MKKAWTPKEEQFPQEKETFQSNLPTNVHMSHGMIVTKWKKKPKYKSY